MAYDVPPPPPQPAAVVQFVRELSDRPNARVRFVTPKVAEDFGNWGATTPPRRVPGNRFRLEPAGVMYIPRSTAQAWESLHHDTGVQWSPESQARALLTLIHESRHLRGGKNFMDEGRAQRWALRQFMPTAIGMGLDRARSLGLLAKAIEYHKTLPKDYRRLSRHPYIKPNGTLGFRP